MKWEYAKFDFRLKGTAGIGGSRISVCVDCDDAFDIIRAYNAPDLTDEIKALVMLEIFYRSKVPSCVEAALEVVTTFLPTLMEMAKLSEQGNS